MNKCLSHFDIATLENLGYIPQMYFDEPGIGRCLLLSKDSKGKVIHYDKGPDSWKEIKFDEVIRTIRSANPSRLGKADREYVVKAINTTISRNSVLT